MLNISQPALREGCDRARDLFLQTRANGNPVGAGARAGGRPPTAWSPTALRTARAAGGITPLG
jgi:hypothetical protein